MVQFSLKFLSFLLVANTLCYSKPDPNSKNKPGVNCGNVDAKLKFQVEFSPEKVVYNKNQFLGLSANFDTELQTHVVVNKVTAPKEDIKFTGILLHGNGSFKSHVGTVLSQIGIIGASKKKKKRSRHNKEGAISLRSEVFKYNKFVKSFCLGLDLPGHGQGPRLEDFSTLPEFLHWMNKAFQKFKKARPHAPLVIFARSGSAGLVAEFNRLYPGVVDVLVGLNPQNPDFIDHSVNTLIDGSKGLEFDIPLLKKIQKFNHQMKWHKDKDPFGNMKTIFFVGENDPELIEGYAEGLREIIGRSKAGQFHFIEDAGHDVLSPHDFYTGTDQSTGALTAYHLIYDFLELQGIQQ